MPFGDVVSFSDWISGASGATRGASSRGSSSELLGATGTGGAVDGFGGHSRLSLSSSFAESPALLETTLELRGGVWPGSPVRLVWFSNLPMRFATLWRGRSSGRGLVCCELGDGRERETYIRDYTMMVVLEKQSYAPNSATRSAIPPPPAAAPARFSLPRNVPRSQFRSLAAPCCLAPASPPTLRSSTCL